MKSGEWRDPVRLVLDETLYIDASSEDKLKRATEEIGARIAKLLG